MNTKRITIATITGFLCGLACAFGATILYPAESGLLILISVVYNRTLIGFVIGITDGIKINPLIRSVVLGMIISVGVAIPVSLGHGLALILFGGIFGIIVEFATTKFS